MTLAIEYSYTERFVLELLIRQRLVVMGDVPLAYMQFTELFFAIGIIVLVHNDVRITIGTNEGIQPISEALLEAVVLAYRRKPS
jgi:hypothetical protein